MMVICLPVISDSIVEAFFILCINYVKGSGQTACFVFVRCARHPSTVAPHKHFHVWSVMDVHLQVSKVSFSARAYGRLHRINPNMIKVIMTK